MVLQKGSSAGRPRFDAPNAPHQPLLWARRGTAHFARHLAMLSDAGLYGTSKRSGVSRAEIVAEIGYQARALTRLVEWARTGSRVPMYADAAQPIQERQNGASLPARALRHLFYHSEIHLNVEWRDLDDAGWNVMVENAEGMEITMEQSVLIRAQSLWFSAIDLDNGASKADIPSDLLDELAVYRLL